MSDTCKAVIISVSIVCMTFIASFALYFYHRPDYSVRGVNNSFAHCVSVVMSESRQSGKVIDAERAKNICIHAKYRVGSDELE